MPTQTFDFQEEEMQNSCPYPKIWKGKLQFKEHANNQMKVTTVLLNEEAVAQPQNYYHCTKLHYHIKTSKILSLKNFHSK